MSFTKCVYHNCVNISRNISMFRFPVHDQNRLILWIHNSGNTYLDSLTNEELRRRYICAAHFMPSSIHKGSIRSSLIGPAVPVHFQCTEVGERTSNQNHTIADADMENDVLSSPEVLKVKTSTKFYKKQTHAAPREEKVSTPSSPTSLFMGSYMEVTPTQRLSRRCLFEGPERRLSRKCLFERNIDDTPKTMRIKNAATNLLKKNASQRACISRLRKKSKTLQKKL